MGELIQDVQLAVRGFWRAPVFTIGAILTLTLAIGANTAIFSLLNALVLRDLPVREPSSLVSLARATPTTADGAFSLPMFRAVAERQQSLSALIGWTSNSVINVEIDDVRTRGNVSAVTGNYFTELGIRPVAGRLLTDTDVGVDTLRSAPIAVIGHGFWQRHFNRDPAAVGRTLRVEGTPFTIVGVAPSGFKGLGLTLEIDVTVPLTFVPLVRDVPSRAFVNGTANSISLTGRLRPGMTLEQARAELTTLWPAVLTAAMPPEYAGAQRQRFLETTIQVREGAKGVEPGLRRRFTQPLVIVMAIALFVVLIACVNIASLMMSRASARMHEMGVRLALGAGRWRLIRIVLVEGVLLSLVGALFGVLVAMWGSESLVAVILATYTVPPSFDVHPDLRVMGFTIGLAVARWPAVLRGAGLAGRSCVGRCCAAAQYANGDAQRPRRPDSGRGPGGAVARAADQRRASRTQPAGDPRRRFRPADRRRVRRVSRPQAGRIPGCRSRQLLSRRAPTPRSDTRSARRQRVSLQAGSRRRSRTRAGLPRWRCRGFIRSAGGPDAGVAGVLRHAGSASAHRPRFRVARSLAQPAGRRAQSYPCRSPVRRRRCRRSTHSHRRGPRGPGRRSGGHRGRCSSAQPQREQRCGSICSRAADSRYGGKCYVIGGRGVSIAAVRQAVESLGVELINSSGESLDFIVGRALLQERLVAAFATFFGALALLMAGIGVYGLTSYHVSERRREIGIRMALGADARRVMGLVVGGAIQITAVGVLVGGAAALAAAQVLRTLLFGVTTYDPITVIGAPALLLLTAIFACLGPAARAARVDPILTLRAE